MGGTISEVARTASADLAKNLWRIALLATAYFVTGKLGLSLASVNPSTTAVWAPTGISLAALLIFGTRVWPGVLLGAFLVNVTTAGTAVTSLAIAAGNTLEALLGAYLVNRFAGGRNAFDRALDVFKFFFFAGMVSTTASATVGTTSLALGGHAHWANYGAIWLTWWLGDAVGAVAVAPLIILWSKRPGPHFSRQQFLESTMMLLYLILVGSFVFGGPVLGSARVYPLEFLCIPFLIWAAFRLGPREAATAIFVLAAIAIAATFRGSGPFVRPNQNESLLLVQSFTGVMAAMTLSLAAVVAESRKAEQAVRDLSVLDALTGLANYRRLLEVVDTEIQRSSRTGRPFSILLLDMDRLKDINDSAGHLVGSRALCRLADVLRLYSRQMDTAARFGGDEFVVVLPEIAAHEARGVGLRITERLTADLEKPPLATSWGVAECPRDGDSFQSLLRAADRELYVMKALHHGEVNAVPRP